MRNKRVYVLLIIVLSFLLVSCQSNSEDHGIVGSESTTEPITKRTNNKRTSKATFN